MSLNNVRNLFPADNGLPRWLTGLETDADRITKHGWDPFVECSFCGDTGTLPISDLPCHCLTGMALEKQRKRAEQWPTIVPRAFRSYTLAEHPNRKLANEVCTWMDSHPTLTGENLIVQGPIGCGKTGAAIAALRELHFTGALVRHWFLPDLMDQLRTEEMGRADDLRQKPTMSYLLDCDVLLLDDAGKERNSRYVEERMLVIINGRYTRNLPTILTTNIGDGWEQYLGPAAASRITENVRIIKATGADLRRRTQ